MLSVPEGNRIHNVYSEPSNGAELLQDRDVSRAAVPEAVIMTDEQLRHSEPAAQHAIHEFLGSVRREIVREGHQCEVLDARLRENLELFFSSGQEKWRRCRIDDLERMGIEADDKTWKPCHLRPVNQSLNYVEMTAVNTVEGPDGDYRSGYRRRKSRLGRIKFV